MNHQLPTSKAPETIVPVPFKPNNDIEPWKSRSAEPLPSISIEDDPIIVEDQIGAHLQKESNSTLQISTSKNPDKEPFIASETKQTGKTTNELLKEIEAIHKNNRELLDRILSRKEITLFETLFEGQQFSVKKKTSQGKLLHICGDKRQSTRTIS